MFKNKKYYWLIGGLIAFGITVALFTRGVGQTKANATDTAKVTSVTLAESIDASGYLEAQSSADLAWKTSGTVEQVYVKVGDKFKAGKVLMSLQTSSTSANIIAAQADLVSAKQNLDDVINSSLALAQAQKDLAVAKQAVEDAQEDVDKIDWPRADDDLIDQTEDEIALMKKKISFLEDVYKRYKKRPAGDPDKAQAELNLINARNKRDELTSTLNWYRGKPSDIDAENYRAALSVAMAQQADAQREVDRLKNGPTTDDVAAAQARVDAAQATVNMLNIIAPFDGEVLSIEQHPGDEVSTGTIAIYVANRSIMHVDAQVDEADISRIQIGNPVTIEMDTVPDQTFTGKVTFINPVGQSVSGLIKYPVTIELDPVDSPLLLGATADVTIMVSEPRSALAVPATSIQSDDAGEYVTVILSNGRDERVNVRSSTSIGELVVVSGNLKLGDTVHSNYDYATTVKIPGMK